MVLQLKARCSGADVEPVLRTVYPLLADRDFVSSDEVISALDPPPADALTTGRALRELCDHGYIDGSHVPRPRVAGEHSSDREGPPGRPQAGRSPASRRCSPRSS